MSAMLSPNSMKPIPATQSLESPALVKSKSGIPAYEVKFLVREAIAREVEQQLQGGMALDPHADPALGNSYQITSVYFDTPAWDVLNRSDGFRRRKFRIRRYGSDPIGFLEQKSKRDQQVRKRRSLIPLADLGILTAPPEGWDGLWFARRLERRNFRPVCRVTYRRVAYVGSSLTGPIRVTFDRAAHGVETTDLFPEVVDSGTHLLEDEVIVEFKFLLGMPTLFKDVIGSLQLTPSKISKYRRCAMVAKLGNERVGDA